MPATIPPSATTVPAIGSRVLTSPPLRGPGASSLPPPWPSYRAPVTISVGTEKTVTVMVVEARFGYRVELRDRRGRALAGSAGPPPAGTERRSVLLLSDVKGAEATLEALPQQVAPNLDVIQLPGVRDFPDVALHLAGLHAVVIDDFDSATLSPGQRRALQDYVSLGGTLVVAGGAAWSRTLGSLPVGLTPLRASSSAAGSVGPLADLAAGTTTATATLATGDVGAGRIVLAAPNGPPLVVEADYGAGRVVQLAYDPLAEPFASDVVLGGPAWDQALGRTGPRWGGFAFGTSPSIGAEDQLWRPALMARGWPSWPRSGLAAQALFAVAAGPAGFLLARRRRSERAWLALPLAVVLSTGVSLLADQRRSEASETVVEVRTSGADGAVLTSTYRGVVGLRRPEVVQGAGGAALSTVFTAQPVFHPVGGLLDPLSQQGPQSPVPRGVGGGAILAGGAQPGVRLPARPWDLRTVQTLSIDQGGPSLDAALRLVGTAGTPTSRLTGTVTNRGSVPVHQVRAQIVEGQARVADELAPGATRQVDAPVITVGSTVPPRDIGPQPPDEVAMFAAAARSTAGPGQVVLVGLTTPPITGVTGAVSSKRRRIGISVTALPLKGAETVVAGSGGALLVSASPRPGGGRVAVLDLVAPPGVGPLRARYPVGRILPGQASTDQSFEAYSWTTGVWRTLPPTGRPDDDYVESALDGAEVANGVVRLRTTTSGSVLPSPIAQLVLTSASDKAAQG